MTVKDIWDEKPIPFYTAPPGGEGVYHTEKMDTWLEKLKAEFDRLQKEGLEHHAIAVEYYEKLEAIKTYAQDLSTSTNPSKKNVGLKLLEILQGYILQKIEAVEGT